MHKGAFEIIESTPNPIWSIDPEYRLIAFNSAFRSVRIKRTGQDPKPGDHVLAGIYPAHFRAQWESRYEQALGGERIEWDASFPDDTGQSAYYEIGLNPIRNENGAVIGVSGIKRDITDRRRFELNNRILLQAVEQSPLSMLITDPEGRMIYVNSSFERMSGYIRREIEGKTPGILKSGMTPPGLYDELWRTIRQGETWRGELLNRNKNGDLYWENLTISPFRDESDELAGYIAYQEDISLRKEQEEKIFFQTHFDSLTRAPNRLLGLDRLKHALEESSRLGTRLLLAFIDLDDFKKINDTLGHRTGDELLRMVAERLGTILREGDTLARFGGDEFFIAFTGLADLQEAESHCSELLEVFSKPFFIEDQELDLTISMGLAVAPDDGQDSYMLLRNAEAAMYGAKRKGRNTLHFFTASMNQEMEDRLRMEYHLRRALEREELYLEFQPIVSLADGSLKAGEALLRWNNPKLGPVPPSRFIPLAEEIGLIVRIGEWVLDRACRELKRWLEAAGREDIRMAVNISPRQFQAGDIPDAIEQTLERFSLSAKNLEVEVTEGLFLRQYQSSTEQLRRIEAAGVNIAMDDFGTGYSSLRYLQSYPFHTLKIDGAFVREITTNEESRTLVATIAAMARQLGMLSVAEGVETAEQLSMVAGMQCDVVQGFYISPPLSPDDFLSGLQENRFGARIQS